jgi:hypothetical protein
MIPIVIEQIILDYKDDLEYYDLKQIHKKKFQNTLYLIDKLKNINNGYYWDYEIESIQRTRRTITIGPMNKNNHTICYCFSICLNCNNYIHSSRTFNYNIAKICKCF